jgi:amidase
MNDKTAMELARLIRTKAVSPVEVLAAHLDAIDRANPAINAIVTLATDQAMDAARAAEDAVVQGRSIGPLHGVPVGIKDVTPTAGIRTTYASRLFADHVPTEDAEVVARLKAAGAIVVGKTNTPEFATGANTVNDLFGATRNPWDLRLTAGGSTGGGAAAVAARMLPLAEGTDVGCSLRVPAAYCGVIGLRPTAGVVPNSVEPQPWDVTTVHGPVARDAADAALMLDAMAGASTSSPISFDPPWRGTLARLIENARDLHDVSIGYVADIAGLGVDSEIEQVCRSAALRLAQARAEVREVALDLADGCDAYQVLRGEWMVSQYSDRLDQLDSFGPNLAGNIAAGLKLTTRDIAASERTRADIWRRLRSFFNQHDLLLTPTLPVPPFPVEKNHPTEIGGRKLDNYTTWFAPAFLISLVSLPAASVPAGMTSAGLPIGIQIIGPRCAEPRILACAKLIAELNPIGPPPHAAASSSRARSFA